VFVCRALADGDGNREAQKEVQNIALDNNFAIPGDPGFPLNQVFPPFPSSLFSAYFTSSLPTSSLWLGAD
jgi:hypothetical protein